MKKYQLWLQRKSYSQHLENLMKIKFESTRTSKFKKIDKIQEKKKSERNSHAKIYKSLQQSTRSPRKFGDVSYAITSKQLKNHKLRAMKTFEIFHQNINMERRVRDAKSAFSTSNNTFFTNNIQKRRKFEKKCILTNKQLRERNFKKFEVLHSTKSNFNFHKYQLQIRILYISRHLERHEFSSLWIEIENNKGKTKSQCFSIEEIDKNLIIPLENELPEQARFRLCYSKGLQSIILADFKFLRPNIGQQIHRKYSSVSQHMKQLVVGIKYQRVEKKRAVLFLK